MNHISRFAMARRAPQCPICGDHPTLKELIDYDPFCDIQPAQFPVGDCQFWSSGRAGVSLRFDSGVLASIRDEQEPQAA